MVLLEILIHVQMLLPLDMFKGTDTQEETLPDTGSHKILKRFSPTFVLDAPERIGKSSGGGLRGRSIGI
ncbi:MAG: hypothetical protein LUH23_04675 [Oscillospiraceae bacterium]|nr:hypothetical protein [Oscillospiraceae bacterium]